MQKPIAVDLSSRRLQHAYGERASNYSFMDEKKSFNENGAATRHENGDRKVK